jgi:Rps23 Pro-64 3,4-dihydroxylase Tpa1-like proline 4-hydroxylase
LREIIYSDFLNLLQKITNVELLPNKIDVTSSKYEFSDYLLCHDDDIHDDNGKGRRFAFIYYLVPDDWDLNDGGTLDLFSCDGKQIDFI